MDSKSASSTSSSKAGMDSRLSKQNIFTEFGVAVAVELEVTEVVEPKVNVVAELTFTVVAEL